jgi:hypothetical protein
MTIFYVIEATLHRGFTDPVGPAEDGSLATPSLALSQIEASPATTVPFRASDVGYRSRASDPQGVQAYPPRIAQAFSIDVAANLDPTQSNVGASWGQLVLSNTDGLYDSLIASLRSDGQMITIYRGDKAIDARGIAVDPPFASLVPIFVGVMGPWKPAANIINIDLFDASFYFSSSFPRTLYGGTGTADGQASATGVAKPMIIGEGAFNLTPFPLDPANLIYQFHDGAGVVDALWDGGVPLTNDGLVGSVYSGTPAAAGHFRYDNLGRVQVGSTPIFGLTLDGSNLEFPAATSVARTMSRLLGNNLGVPISFISDDGFGQLVVSTADAAATLSFRFHQIGIYLAAGEAIDGATLISRLISSTTSLLVPGRDGKLRLMLLAPVPLAAVPVLSLDDSNIISITPVPLPATVDPPPARMRLSTRRNWTVQPANAQAGAITAAQAARVAIKSQIVTGVAATPLASAFSARTDPPVIGDDGGPHDTSAGNSQGMIDNAIALWGVRRRHYDVTVPQSIGLTLDWASIVRVTSSFDGLNSGLLGQIVGWHYASGDPTATFRVLI